MKKSRMKMFRVEKIYKLNSVRLVGKALSHETTLISLP